MAVPVYVNSRKSEKATKGRGEGGGGEKKGNLPQIRVLAKIELATTGQDKVVTIHYTAHL